MRMRVVEVMLWRDSMVRCCDELFTVADLGGVRGVQLNPPLVASNVFSRAYILLDSISSGIQQQL